MILDKNLVLSDGQDIDAISGSATPVVSDTIVVGKADFGYKGMFFVVKADEEIKSASANGDVTISVEASDTTDFSTKTTLFTQSFANFVKSTATVAKGEVLVKTLLRDCGGLKYVRVSYAGDGTWAKNAGQGDTMKVSAFITFDYPNQ